MNTKRNLPYRAAVILFAAAVAILIAAIIIDLAFQIEEAAVCCAAVSFAIALVGIISACISKPKKKELNESQEETEI